MKKTLFIFTCLLATGICYGQSKKDTVMLDSTHTETIRKMPMDTLNDRMPVVPLHSDSTQVKPKTIDDVDPKQPKNPKISGK